MRTKGAVMRSCNFLRQTNKLADAAYRMFTDWPRLAFDPLFYMT